MFSGSVVVSPGAWCVPACGGSLPLTLLPPPPPPRFPTAGRCLHPADAAPPRAPRRPRHHVPVWWVGLGWAGPGSHTALGARQLARRHVAHLLRVRWAL